MNNSCCIKEVPAFSVTLCYIAVTEGTLIDTYAPRFVKTYLDYPSGFHHRLVVICNGPKIQPHRQKYFDGTGAEFFHRANDEGKDISGYQHFAQQFGNQFLVCLGESIFFHRPGWLARLVHARMEFGEGIYASFATHAVRAHMNTTGFGCDAKFIRQFPAVNSSGMRYEFEHGPTAMWRRIVQQGGEARLVTWDGTWTPGQWRLPNNIYHRGDQSNCLMFCNHTTNFESATEVTKALWVKNAEIPFR